MKIKRTLPATEARKELFTILKELERGSEYFTITQNGRPRAVLLSAEQFESWAETLEVMRDFPDLKKDIAEAERDYQSGKYHEYKTLEQLLSEEGFVVADKPKKKYAVRRSSKTGGRKKPQKNS